MWYIIGDLIWAIVEMFLWILWEREDKKNEKKRNKKTSTNNRTLR
jgi:hypothetical protein